MKETGGKPDHNKDRKSNKAKPLSSRTHAEILKETLQLTQGPGSRKIKHEGIHSYRDAIAEGDIDPDFLGPRYVPFTEEIPETDKTEEVTVSTFGESMSVSDPTEEGARNLAEIVVYVGWDLEKEANPSSVGIFETVVGVNDHVEATYTFVEFREDPDPAQTALMYERYDKWGVPRKSADNADGGKLTDEQGTILKDELHKKSQKIRLNIRSDNE
jgi:hypothetical protein